MKHASPKNDNDLDFVVVGIYRCERSVFSFRATAWCFTVWKQQEKIMKIVSETTNEAGRGLRKNHGPFA